MAGNGPAMDNPPVLSPAGRVHCTIQDWAKFIADQLRGARGEPDLPLLLSLEHYDAETKRAAKASIFRERTV